VVGGIYYRLQVAHMKLCASRAFWLVAYPSQGHEMLFDAHTRSVRALGGVARRGIYDNMKTAVDKVKKGKGRSVNERFEAMCAHYLFDAEFCNGLRLGEGRRREERAGQPPAHLDRGGQAALRLSFVELNAWLGEPAGPGPRFAIPSTTSSAWPRCWSTSVPTSCPCPSPFDGYVEKPARVSSTCWCRWRATATRCRASGADGQHASVPGQACGGGDDKIVCATTALEQCRGQTIYDWQHYIPLLQRKPGALRNGAPFVDMPEPLQQLRQRLLRNPAATG
jgi:hypothetical protein